MNIQDKETIRQVYEEARSITPGDYGGISEVKYCSDYGQNPSAWRIGPLKVDESMTFTKRIPFTDPTEIGWKSGFIFNPSLIEHDKKLYLFYRAAPQKESLSSRIGLAIYTENEGWTDLSCEPIIYPTEHDETHGTEDPKVYPCNGKFYMFYQADWVPNKNEREQILNGRSPSFDKLVTVTKLAVSTDLLHWEKKGIAVPYEISYGWSKGAVIPKNPKGEPVRINGSYMMFVSEGCGGHQVVGYSEDFENWRFEQQEYLKLPKDMGHILEVSCCCVDYEPTKKDMLLDFFYMDNDGNFCAAQAHYFKDEPFKQLEIAQGGTLAWGGLIRYNDKWLVAQGWDAPIGEQVMYFYKSE